MRKFPIGFYVALGSMIVGLCLIVIWVVSSSKSAIEEGKVYKIGYTYKAELPNIGDARVFDFADRNLPEKSIVVPFYNHSLVPLVVVRGNLPEATARLTRIKVPAVVVEGITYHSEYEYPRWEYNPGRTEVQSVVPTLTPKK